MKTTPTVEIEASLAAVAARIVVGLGSCIACAAIALHAVPPMDDVLDLMIGGVGLAASAVWTGLWLWRLGAARGPVVTIAAQGIRDRRIAADMVPWSAVAHISTFEDAGAYRVMVLSLDPRAERALAKSRRRKRDAQLPADGLRVAELGLRTSYETLLSTTLAYLEAWRSSRRI